MVVRLATAEASVSIAPELGASVLVYTLRDGRQIFRPALQAADAFETACYLLVPWCNRIDGGITLPGGEWQGILPTHPKHPLPIHGSGALTAWTVEQVSQDRVQLSAICDWPEPFHYRATVQYMLTGMSLGVELSVQHLGEAPLPYGLGLHPWFVRTPDTRLLAKASHWQVADARQIPTGIKSVDAAAGTDFNTLCALPADLIDAAFGGWDGKAVLNIDDQLKVVISAEPALSHYQVYSTGENADFVCFEPVSHPVNAHNLQGCPGLKLLDQDAVMQISVVLTPIVASIA